MKNRYRKNLIISLLCAFCCLMATAMFNVFHVENVIGEIVGAPPLLSKYLIDETIIVPKKQIVYGGQSYETEWYIEQPSGKRICAEEIVLEESGWHNLVYYTNIGKLKVKSAHEFFVVSRLYDVSSERSKIVYGDSAYEGVSGANVSLASGDNFVYNKVIDISNFTSSDNIVSLVVAPSELGVVDAEQLHITLTDAYDKNNYVIITVKQNTSSTTSFRYTSYVTAHAGGIQLPSGLEKSTTGTYEYNGQKYKIHSNNRFGSYFTFSMTGTFAKDADKVGAETLNVSMDTATTCVYVNNGRSSAPLVSKLNDTNIYATAWEGFTTGEVYVSINATAYTASKFNFTLKRIENEDIAEINEFETLEKPNVVVDCPASIPNAIVGLTYPIFAAKAVSAYDNDVNLETRVYYNYANDDTRFEVDIKNNRFSADLQGTYSIVYTARDKYGNTQYKEIKVNSISTDKRLTLALNDGYATQAKIVDSVLVASYVVQSYYGDNYDVKIQARLKNSDVVYDIGEDLQFVPQYAGEYEIVYTCSDITDTQTVKYTVTVQTNPKPVLDACYFPKYVIKNASYEFPKVYATDYSQLEPKRTDCATLEIAEYKGGSEIKNTVVTGRYTVGDCDYIVATYTITTPTGSDSSEYKAVAVDVGYGNQLDLSAYFYDTNACFEKTKNMLNIEFSTNLEKTNGADVAELTFINSLSSREFEVRFSSIPEKNGFESLNVKLTGMNGNVLNLTYFPQGADTAFYINGKLAGLLGVNFFDSTRTFYLAYDETTKIVSPLSGKKFDVTKVIDGFTGLGEKLSFSIVLNGIADEAGFLVSRVVNQIIGNNTKDAFSPKIDQRPILGFCKMGTVVTIAASNILDVLDPNVEYTFQVLRPDGSIARDVNNQLLDNVNPSVDYKVLLDESGSWKVKYTAKDSGGKEVEYGYGINVPDVIAPEVELSGGDRSGSIGKKIQLATAIVSDNMGATTVYAFVKDGDGKYHRITNNYFVCDKVGTYTVYFYVIDLEGNLTIEEYDVLIKE